MMNIEQIYTGCISQGAYYIESEGEVAIIDPLRETKPYIERAKERNHTIKYILETHFHADFVSGHVDLAKMTGAKIVFGPGANPNYEIYQATDGEELSLGKVRIKVLHTPGHTQESTCYLLHDDSGNPHSIFTGDTLFIGDVGRPDLAVETDLTQEDLAGMLYDSLRTKVMPLPDSVVVYPAHGAGSACGKNMSTETYDTLGHQKETNYALQPDLNRDEFIKEVTEDQLPAPQYFAKNAALNQSGYESIDKVMERGVVGLNVEHFEDLVNMLGALILDVRHEDDFRKGFIPNSIFIGLHGSFASWVGTLIPDLQQPIVFVSDAGKEEETVMRLARVGYDNCLGYLEGGFQAWKDAGKETDTIQSISAHDFSEQFEDGMSVLDVRKPAEYEQGHIANAKNHPLNFVNDHMGELDHDDKYYVHCQGGYRSVVMSSILKSRGYENVIDIKGGFDAIKTTVVPTTEYSQPTF